MKLICNGNDLSEAVGKVFKAVSTRQQNPVLEGILIRATEGSVTLTASDSDLTIEKSFVADVKIAGETVVPGRLFADFVKRLTREQIELNLDEKNKLRIRYGGSEGTLQCLSALDYPATKTPDEGQVFVILGSDFKDLIAKTSFSVCADESRPVLKGVLLEVNSENITAVALDGYRLARCIKPIQKSAAAMSAIVPARCLNEIARLIEEGANPLSISIGRSFLEVDLGHTRIISQLIQGDFVSYKQIIPDFFNSEVIVSSEQFEESLERAILLSRLEKNNLVRFDIGTDSLVISSNSEVGAIEERLSAKLSGEDLTIAFNAKYFVELIKYIDCETVIIKFTTPVSPCVIQPLDPKNDLLYLVLPVRLIN